MLTQRWNIKQVYFSDQNQVGGHVGIIVVFILFQNPQKDI